MHRTSSAARFSDEYSINMSPTMKGSPSVKSLLVSDDETLSRNVNNEYDEDPNIVSHVTKKDGIPKLLSGEKSIHLIPLVLILCALVLWVFSTTPGFVVNKDLTL
ncbi:hypothetical protein Leryth_024546 [Lithospermum erythrorhizon]|nr:hypothetical protein Leryth_024546 [Lithospermum erythrorhizon]